MRLAGQEKLGYYPTPPRITSIIRERLDFSSLTGPYAALDPCAGEGIALAQLTKGTDARLFGIEPDSIRCEEARTRFYRVLHSTREESTISHAAFSLLFLNPPYDEEHEINEDGKKKTTRKEIIFLQQTLPYLAPQGVLVFIVPAHIFRPDVILYLTQRLDNLEIWHFPEPERSEFGQAVAIGTKSSGKAINPALAQISEEVPYDRPPHRVPPSNPDVKIFRTNRLNPVELATLAENSPLLRFFSGATATRATERRPPLSLHAGHLSLLLASGALDGLCAPGTPDRHVVRGKTSKYHRISKDSSYNDETGSTTVTTKTRDAYRVSVKILRPTGEILELE